MTTRIARDTTGAIIALDQDIVFIEFAGAFFDNVNLPPLHTNDWAGSWKAFAACSPRAGNCFVQFGQIFSRVFPFSRNTTSYITYLLLVFQV
jgi:hypothetical protein